MNPENSTSAARFLGRILVMLGLLFSLQGLVYYGLNGRSSKSESNYFSSLSRFQAAASHHPEFVLVGSSITGRLPGAEVGREGVANLGSDGGSAFDGMSLLANGIVERPRWLVVETNTLFGGLGQRQSLIVRGAGGHWFGIGARLPLLGASARPSGMLYSRLLRRSVVLDGEPFEVTLSTVPHCDHVFSPAENERLDAYARILEDLRRRGVGIVLVRYPSGFVDPAENARLEAAVSNLSTRVPFHFLDLSGQVPRDQLEFTDSVHLAPASAARIMDTIAAACRRIRD